ncbi:ankyrin repeat-containing domain protein, partial [Cladorrhinum sp. PSN259]
RGLQPIDFAVRAGHEAMIVLTLGDMEANLNRKDHLGFTALSYAAIDGRTEIVNLLLKEDKVMTNVKKKGLRNTANYSAPLNGHASVVSVLLKFEEVDANPRSSRGSVPLSLVAETGGIDVVELLLASVNIDPNAKDWRGCTPLWCASVGDKTKVVKLLFAFQQSGYIIRGQCRSDRSDSSRTIRNPTNRTGGLSYGN